MGNDISILAFARLVLDAIEAMQLEYMIGGSFALYAWGDVRTTRDFDLVVHLPGQKITGLSQELAARRMLVPPEILLDLLIQPEGDLPVNAIHLDSGYKAELFLLRPDDAFRTICLARRRQVDLGEPLGMVFVHAPDDLIINKVKYYGLNRQTKHVRDIASIFAVSGDQIDWVHLSKWIRQLDLVDVWLELKHEVDKLLNQ
ncbi:MAG: hypothetical protein BroJett021_31780 [Chloroflexota bacterium]|nr:MAG: hypothetical protein BroJett021_31780 [Chloroflexota bacterium]